LDKDNLLHHQAIHLRLALDGFFLDLASKHHHEQHFAVTSEKSQ
jgi:hypothetical protein